MNHSFNIEIATMLNSVEKAVIVENIAFWIKKNIVNKKHIHDNMVWTYNSSKAFSELFPYWSDKKISRLLSDMVKASILTSGNYNKVKFDRTRWYSINSQAIRQLYNIHFSELSNGADSIEKSEFSELGNAIPINEQPIPYINSDVNPDIKKTLVGVSDKSKKKAEVFEKLWEVYNYKKNKKGSKSAFMKLSEKDIEEIRKQLPLYLKSSYTDGVSKPSRMHLSTYLNNRRWEDEIIPVKSNSFAPQHQERTLSMETRY